jgi:hypothetical protein
VAPPPVFRAANALEDALAAALAGGSPDAVVAVLAEADVLLPAPAGAGPVEEVERQAAPGDELDVPRLEVDGRTYVPVFTSPVQLLRFRPEGGPYLRLSGRAVASLCPRHTAIAVNPGGELGCVIPPEAVSRVARRAPAPTPTPPGTAVVAEPVVEPAAVLDALRAAAAHLPAIEALHRAELDHGGPGKELVVGLELADGADAPVAVEALAAAARSAGAERLALLPLPSGQTDDPVARFLAGTTPFYERVTALAREGS